MSRFILYLFASCLASLVASATVVAADLQLKVEPAPAPQELSAEIRSLLQTRAVRLLDGDKAVIEFWFRTDVPLTAAPKESAKSLDALKPLSVLGAVRISSELRDYRDDELPAGVYTMRLGLQPSDGNHLGSSDFTYFAVLIPAKYDLKPDGLADTKAMTKASSKDTSTGHPLILSLRPVSGAAGAEPSLQEPVSEHKAVRLRLAGKAGEAKAEVAFDLVYSGKVAK